MKPKNQHQLVIYYLFNWEEFSLKDVINDSMFFKMQTRLSEIQAKFGNIAHSRSVGFTNRFGRKGNYKIYTSNVSNQRLIEIYKSYE